MKIAMTLPSMAKGYDRETTLAWCRGVDEGPFSSLACGERITFHNQEMRVLLGAAAALTARVRIVPTLYVLPMHPTGLVAKEVATLDVLSGGRVTVCVGTGGREQDYRAVGARFEGRFHTQERQVRELRRLWSGESAFDGAPPIGPACVQKGGPPLWCGGFGPKTLERAAHWADAVMGFTALSDIGECEKAFAEIDAAWEKAQRATRAPRISGFWYGLGPGADARLRQYVYDYIRIGGEKAANFMAGAQKIHSEDAFRAALDRLEAAGCDECFLVPSSTDPAELDRTAEAVAKR
jgi:alkanesulfonate monooxygenase SsuD/methylene tetrahydromethanopterin reductase-like flavin-dependent oxidoreductase (luciferase family)